MINEVEYAEAVQVLAEFVQVLAEFVDSRGFDYMIRCYFSGEANLIAILFDVDPSKVFADVNRFIGENS